MGGAAGGNTTSDLSKRHVARRKWATFVSSAKGCNDLSESSYVKPLALIFIKVEII